VLLIKIIIIIID